MSEYNMIVVGFHGLTEIEKAISALNLNIHDVDSQPAQLRDIHKDFIEVDTSKFDNTLDMAYEEMAKLLGWSRVAKKMTTYNSQTPFGARETIRFEMELLYNFEDLSTVDEDAFFGINLTGRYYPVLLDAKNEHGGLPNPIDIAAYLKDAETCRKLIAQYLPVFETSKILIYSARTS